MMVENVFFGFTKLSFSSVVLKLYQTLLISGLAFTKIYIDLYCAFKLQISLGMQLHIVCVDLYSVFILQMSALDSIPKDRVGFFLMLH